MCVHSQLEALAQGFRAMQVNLGVSTNDTAVRLWQKLGFDIVRHVAWGLPARAGRIRRRVRHVQAAGTVVGGRSMAALMGG